MRRSPTEMEYMQGKEIVTSILFSNSNEIIQKLKPICFPPDQLKNVCKLVNEKKVSYIAILK